MTLKFLRLAALFPFLLALDACAPTDANGNGDDGGQKFGVLSLFDPAPSAGNSTIVPFPFDGLFAGFTDPTLNIPNSGGVPFVTAANLVDGFSTTASLFTDLTGFVDFSTAASAIVIINSSTHQRLTAGTDYVVQPSPAIDSTAPAVPISSKRSRILIEPLHPLAPSTTYLIALTTDLKSTDGIAATPSDIYKVVSSATPVSQQTAPVLAAMSAQQKAILEQLRSSLIRPAVQGLTALSGLTEDKLVLTWSFTTESTLKTLQKIQATAVAHPISASFTGLNTNQVNPALPPVADVWAGTFTTPYYLQNSGGNTHSTAPLTGFWKADTSAPDVNASFLGQVPCGAFASGATLPSGTATPSVSTTICYPLPLKQSDATIPLLVTVPNANSGQTKPANGWPVVIFQHGITGNRSNMLGIAPALAAGGFVTVAIDLPLHGIEPGDPAAALRIAGLERTYDLDLATNSTGAPGPDGTPDASGTWFINLSSLLTSRDNLRQAVSDLINLGKSVSALDLDGNSSTADIDATRIYLVGHSLGAIVGGTLLGVDTDIRAATLAMPGGGLGSLLDASKAFGPVVSAGLASAGVVEGTDNYETFLRFAQLAVDPGDPINFATAAAAGHPIHMIEVINDLVVPNAAPAGPASATQDLVTITGHLSGTNPLYQEMATSVLGPITPPLAAVQKSVDPTRQADYVVQFATGTHSSILSPAGPNGATQFLAVTQEMQRETVYWLASDGICLPLGGTCP